jgi:hypothetical protein
MKIHVISEIISEPFWFILSRGKITDMEGNDLSYNKQDVRHLNGILATNGLVHDRIVSEFQKSQ